jgi:hypothetical protein
MKSCLIVFFCIIVPVLAFAGNPAGKWAARDNSAALALSPSGGASLSLTSGPALILAAGKWSRETEGKYAGTIRVDLAISKWLKGKAEEVLLSRRFTVYFIESGNALMAANSVSLQSGSMSYNNSDLRLCR